MDKYDSAQDTKQHIERVGLYIDMARGLLKLRAEYHDASKLLSPEKECFDEITPLLKGTTYGSEEYRAALRKMKPAIDHHQKNNRHHPEFFYNGINGMNLIDIIELICDWKAASERHADGNIYRSLEINKERFGISDQLVGILKNTVDYMFSNEGKKILTYQQMQTAKSKTIDSILLSIESEIKKTYRFGRDNITGLVKDAYAKHLVGVDSADYYKTLNLYNRLKDMEQEIKGVYIQIGRQTRKTVTKGMYTTFDESYLMDRYTTAFFSDSIGSNIKYSAPNPIVREVAVTGDATRLKDIRDTRLRRIAEGMIPPSGDTLTGILVNNLNQELTKTLRVVKQGLINGTSYTKQAKALKDTFNGNAYNALRVVRTEGNRLANAGTYLNSEDLKVEGVRTRRQWVATLDGSTRDSHQHLDGQFEDEDGLFHIHGLSARYPGDFGDPAEDIHCRCTTIDVVQGLEPTLRRGINPVTGKSDIASYRDYDKWKKQGLK